MNGTIVFIGYLHDTSSLFLLFIRFFWHGGKKYRNVDVLLIDDMRIIIYLVIKPKSQKGRKKWQKN